MNIELLAEDFERLRNALGDEEWRHHAGRGADVLTGAIPIVPGDSAIDYLIAGHPVAERVRIQRLARAGGYERSWPRAPR